jgi:hypothetical protein
MEAIVQISRTIYFKFVLLLLLLLTTSRELQAQTILPLKKYVGNLKTLQVFIQDKSFNFIFDTGGGETFISPEIAKMLRRPVYGRNTGFRMRGERIEFQRCDDVKLNISGIDFHLPQVAVWDIMSILPKNFPKLDGVVSLHTFSRNKLTLDLRNNQLLVETDRSFKRTIRAMTPVAAIFSTGLQGREINLFIDISIRSKDYRFLFDTGNIDKTKLVPSTAIEMGLKYDSETKERLEVGKIKLKIGQKLIETEGVIENVIYDGVLDFGFISQSVYTIDISNRKAWIR